MSRRQNWCISGTDITYYTEPSAVYCVAYLNLLHTGCEMACNESVMLIF